MTHEQLGNCRSRAGAELATALFFGPARQIHTPRMTPDPLPDSATTGAAGQGSGSSAMAPRLRAWPIGDQAPCVP